MRILCFSLFLLASLVAEESSTSEAEPASQLRDLGQGRYALGLVSFDENTRHLSFPAEVNLVEGILEYAIVHEKGKIHEALLMTKASPLHLNIALKLLHYQESPELFEVLDENYESTGKFPEVSDERKTAARLQILVKWEKDGKKEEVSLNDLIYHTTTEKAMEPVPWIYQGSYIHENSFKAETSGDLAAIYITRSSLINFSGNDNTTDEPWIPNLKRVPPIGTPVTVTITPLLDKPTK